MKTRNGTMRTRKPEPFFYFAAGDDFAVIIVGIRDEKALVPIFMSMRIIVNNNPVDLTDPWGFRRFPFGAGRLCVNSNCNNPCNNDDKPIAYYLPEDDPNPGQKTWLPAPGPGGCVDADAVAGPGGTIKIPDNCTCKIVCDESGNPKHLRCGCIPIPGKSPGPPDPDWPRSPYSN